MEYDIVPCSPEDAHDLCDRLVEYNLSRVRTTQEAPFVPVYRKIIAQDGTVIGGCLSEIYCWNIMSVEVLWIKEAYRRQSLGTKLLRQMEAVATEKGCSMIHLDTFDFQARDFYLKQGYQVFGVLEDCPPGHCRYYLKKKL